MDKAATTLILALRLKWIMDRSTILGGDLTLGIVGYYDVRRT